MSRADAPSTGLGGARTFTGHACPRFRNLIEIFSADEEIALG
ncbi:hypothetical protein DFR71_6067 [Nocardia alba]|uniref:Uncharacterized protein n=1 Tax=Nocardia alba TaxID=225051 RepID=A0A4R1FEF6_9NOCA|nr:hypothetical protein DFR71_6067 [Nocardia alba]